ncbi:MAG: hypothetical protein HQL95_09685 [Magnetococcales bacterium]|nr:hypothetical protein [Magnetococcales bacterium]
MQRKLKADAWQRRTAWRWTGLFDYIIIFFHDEGLNSLVWLGIFWPQSGHKTAPETGKMGIPLHCRGEWFVDSDGMFCRNSEIYLSLNLFPLGWNLFAGLDVAWD